MSWEENSNGRAPRAPEFERVLRRPDGSIDIAAYAKIAHRHRAAAIAFSVRETIRTVLATLSAVRAHLAPVGRSEPASGKHHAHIVR